MSSIPTLEDVASTLSGSNGKKPKKLVYAKKGGSELRIQNELSEKPTLVNPNEPFLSQEQTKELLDQGQLEEVRDEPIMQQPRPYANHKRLENSPYYKPPEKGRDPGHHGRQPGSNFPFGYRKNRIDAEDMQIVDDIVKSYFDGLQEELENKDKDQKELLLFLSDQVNHLSQQNIRNKLDNNINNNKFRNKRKKQIEKEEIDEPIEDEVTEDEMDFVNEPVETIKKKIKQSAPKQQQMVEKMVCVSPGVWRKYFVLQ